MGTILLVIFIAWFIQTRKLRMQQKLAHRKRYDARFHAIPDFSNVISSKRSCKHLSSLADCGSSTSPRRRFVFVSARRIIPDDATAPCIYIACFKKKLRNMSIETWYNRELRLSISRVKLDVTLRSRVISIWCILNGRRMTIVNLWTAYENSASHRWHQYSVRTPAAFSLLFLFFSFLSFFSFFLFFFFFFQDSRESLKRCSIVHLCRKTAVAFGAFIIIKPRLSLFYGRIYHPAGIANSSRPPLNKRW